MIRLLTPVAIALALMPPPQVAAQFAPQRLSPDVFALTPPSDRVEGMLEQMRVVNRRCGEATSSDLRRRIVDVAVQEWAFFGFPVLDRLNGARLLPFRALRSGRVVFENTTRRAPTPGSREGARVAATIAGYWAVTPEGPGIVDAQARRWEERGPGTRWNAPWSAAFISWVMCESGLGSRDQFRRAIAHWTYIDQAIRARDVPDPTAAYVAHDIGDQPVEPGDMLCSGSRPRYGSLAERRGQLGEGARSHCDIVVQVEPEGRILAIGGNVLRSVSMKVLPAARDADGRIVARRTSSAPLYAHLKLRADPIDSQALEGSPVLAALAESDETRAGAPASRVLQALGVDTPWSLPGDGR